MNHTRNSWIFCAGLAAALLAAALLGGAGGRPAQAAPRYQLTPFPTPTPGPDGRILYTVQAGDTLWRISAVSGISIDELRALNNLSADAVINEGQVLLFGLAGPAVFTATPAPSATPAPLQPSPSPEVGSGRLCILLYEDINGDSLRQDTEMSIPGGAISISDRGGQVSITSETQPGDAPDCFDEIPEGDYNITVAAPEGFNPTTVMNYPLRIAAGDETFLDFGAQRNAVIQAETGVTPAAPAEEGPSSLLGILGGVLILAGVGLGIYAARFRK
jgi:murein DD-endopeptidase MepM/ murein hydrolase activator NlpD